MHTVAHPLAGKKVLIKPEAHLLANREYLIEDWWDRVAGMSWMDARGNPACLQYAMRTAFSDKPIPTDDEVVYGKIDGLGYLVHFVELGDVI